MNADELIRRYLLAAAEHWQAQSQLEKSGVVVRANRASDETRQLATGIGRAGSVGVREFSRLLGESQNGVQGWAAFHILEVMDAPPDVVDRAFEVLERLARGTAMNALGPSMRLKELRLEFGREG